MNWLKSLDDQINIACLWTFRLHSEGFNRVWFVVRVLGGKTSCEANYSALNTSTLGNQANNFTFLCLFQAGKKFQSPQIHKDLNISQISGKPLILTLRKFAMRWTWKIGVQFPAWATNFTLFHSKRTASGLHTTSFTRSVKLTAIKRRRYDCLTFPMRLHYIIIN